MTPINQEQLEQWVAKLNQNNVKHRVTIDRGNTVIVLTEKDAMVWLGYQPTKKKKSRYRLPLILLSITAIIWVMVLQIPTDAEIVEREEQERVAAMTPAERLEYDSIKAEKERLLKIKSLFSGWDGSVFEVKRLVELTLHDVKSFEHVRTFVVQDKGKTLIVQMDFRAANAFNAQRLGYIKAEIDLDGKVIKVVDSGTY